MKHTRLLIVGAGPFGLALAALARDRGVEHLMVGKPMSFWRDHMPAGMYLRSAADWHLDPSGVHTIERFLAVQGRTRADVEPLSLQFYLAYTRWFQEEKGLAPMAAHIREIDEDGGGRLRAHLDGGDSITANTVVLALGFQRFAQIPTDLAQVFPAGRTAHTCQLVDLNAMIRRRCLILGGRQSAFEWAALLVEAGATSVDIVHRHGSPRFAEADWSWIPTLMDRFDHDPGWYRRLPQAEKEAMDHRLWAEGRLKIEPWLEPRCRGERIRVWPHTRVVSAADGSDGMAVTLDNGQSLTVDQAIFATGYKADLSRVGILSAGLMNRIAARNGFPVLDDAMETSVPGLRMTSFLATQDFGPFFAFTVAAPAAARMIMRGV